MPLPYLNDFLTKYVVVTSPVSELLGVFSSKSSKKQSLRGDSYMSFKGWDLETVIQNEVSQEEKNKFCILMHIYGI